MRIELPVPKNIEEYRNAMALIEPYEEEDAREWEELKQTLPKEWWEKIERQYSRGMITAREAIAKVEELE